MQFLKLLFFTILYILLNAIINYGIVEILGENNSRDVYLNFILGEFFFFLLIAITFLCFKKKLEKDQPFVNSFSEIPRLFAIIFLFLIVVLPFYHYDNILLKQPLRYSDNIDFLNYGILIGLSQPLITAPIIEEIFFRGIVLKDLLLKNGLVLSLVFSSFLFLLPHFDYVNMNVDIKHFIILFFFSIILGVIYYKTKNILYPILAHMVYNILITILVNRNYFIDFINVLEFGIWYWLLIIASVLLLIYLLTIFYRKEKPLGQYSE